MAKGDKIGTVKIGEKVEAVYGVETAPIVVFDGAAAFGSTNGMLSVTLICNNQLPASGPTGAINHIQVTGILKMTPVGAASLADTLQKMLLASAPVGREN